jgi:hypothetical protein
LIRPRLAVPTLLALCCGGPLTLGSADRALPSASAIVARYDEALGGRKNILKHTSTTMRGTLTVQGTGGQPMALPFLYIASAPYKRLERVSLPDNGGDVLNGFDGEVAWSFDPRNKSAQIYDGTDRASMKRDADYYYALDELTWFKSMETVAEEDFEGQHCFRLHGINNWGKSNDHFYDRDTGLLAGYEFASDFGPTHEIFSDYQKLDGVLFPMKQTVKVNANDGHGWTARQVLTYTSVTFNDVDPAAFALPRAIRELLAKRKSDSAGSR